MQLFGKSAQELNPLIAQGSAGIAELTEEAKRMGAVMSEDSLNALGAFDASIQRLKAGGEAAKNMLGTVLLPQLQILAGDGVSLLGDFTRGLSEAYGDWTKISEVIGNTVGNLVNMLMENLPNLIQVGLDIVTSIGGAIVDNLPIIIDAAVQIVMTLLQALIDALPQITEGALQLVMALVQGIIDNLPALVEAAVQMIAALASGIGEALPEPIPAVVEAIILICETLIDNMDQILDAAFAIIEGLAQGLLNALPKLIEALPEIIASIINYITSNLPKIIEMGITLIVQLAVGLIKAIPELVKALPQIVAAILEGLGKAASSVVEIGRNIVRGIWEGIKSLGSWLWDKVSGFFSGIVDGVKNFLGIRSPSTVFEGIGGNMALGLGEGFDKAIARVADDMQSAIPTDFDMNANMNVNGATAGGSAASASGPLVVVQQMIVRSEDDIRRISQELYNLIQTGSRRRAASAMYRAPQSARLCGRGAAERVTLPLAQNERCEARDDEGAKNNGIYL
jgi:phage-related protein